MARKIDREKINTWRKKRRADMKIQVLERYGAVCQCCGESNIGFLTIDHRNNDGHVARKENKYQRNIYDFLFHRPVDIEAYQVLCFNCNFGKNTNDGVCPHLSYNKNILT